MATTFLQQGDKIEMIAPVGGVVVDVPHLSAQRSEFPQ